MSMVIHLVCGHVGNRLVPIGAELGFELVEEVPVDVYFFAFYLTHVLLYRNILISGKCSLWHLFFVFLQS